MTNGVFTTSDPNTPGITGTSENHTPQAGAGVLGQSDAAGVWGISQTWHGVVGQSSSSTGGTGVWGEHFTGGIGVGGRCDVGTAIWGASSNGEAGHFEGKVIVNGDLTAHDLFVAGGDCAEEFDVAKTVEIEPGTVMVLDRDGALQPSQQAYDKRVAGVISGAGDYKPGIVLDKRQPSAHRGPVALVGKVYCKVDAHYGSIEVGDLLTTSDTPGCAMKAADPLQAFGSVIGKALRPLQEGQGCIPILIALQ